MTNYVFIESRDPFASRDLQFVTDTATALRQRGNEVTIFLVQNGALAARSGANCSHLPQLAKSGIRLLADDFSLREHGITRSEMLPEVQPSSIDTLVELLVQSNTKALWH